MPIIFALLLAVADGGDSLPPLPDWGALPELPYRQPRHVSQDMAAFVAHEISQGRCKSIQPVDGHYSVKLDVAVMLTPRRIVRAAIPHAIDCPSVEQYGAGLVVGFANNNIARRAVAGTWYRTAVSFDWTEPSSPTSN